MLTKAALWARITHKTTGGLLLLPAVAFLFVFLIVPAVTLLSYSVMTQTPSGNFGAPLTFANYERLLVNPTYQRATLLTLRVAFLTAIVTTLLSYPLAIVIAYGRPMVSRIVMILVVTPLVVNVIVRTYGWQLMLGNNPTSGINWLLKALGAGKTPLALLYTEWATIVASVHVFLPLMVLPVATSLGRISPSLNEAARMLGAPAWRAFLNVALPLSLPGLTAGLTIVFSLTAASYVTPQMVGGPRPMLGILLEQEVTTSNNWPMGGAIATVMVTIALVVMVGVNWFAVRRERLRSV